MLVNHGDLHPKKNKFANPVVDVAASSQVGNLLGKLGLGCNLTEKSVSLGHGRTLKGLFLPRVPWDLSEKIRGVNRLKKERAKSQTFWIPTLSIKG